ncbi:MAG: DUF928 domain-containing protein [Cyanobacteria bacterium P01_H01_bin.152]
MNNLLPQQRFGIGMAAGLLLGSSGLAIALPAIAQSTIRLQLPDISAPGNRESGSTRNEVCMAPDANLIALMPESNYGLTERAYPTVYFYLPATTAEHLKFVLLNEATNELVYEGHFQIQSDEGIASVSLPNNGIQQPLAVGEAYVWYVAVICEPGAPGGDVVTEGQIARVEPLVIAPETAETELPGVYAAAGIWYDALATSATLKQDADNTAAWNALLDAVELDSLVPIELLSTAPLMTVSAPEPTP